jgi:hypothetical protein
MKSLIKTIELLIICFLLTSCLTNEEIFVKKVMENPNQYEELLKNTNYNLKYLKNLDTIGLKFHIQTIYRYIELSKNTRTVYSYNKSSVYYPFENDRCKRIYINYCNNVYDLFFLFYENNEGIIYYEGVALFPLGED